MKQMKSIAAATLFSFFSLAVFAQTQEPQTQEPATQAPQEMMPAQPQGTVASDSAMMSDSDGTASNLLPMPAPLTQEKIFPVIGLYQASGAQTEGPASITVMLDLENKGIAWIDGLPQGKVKALLLKSPATYKIPAQKTTEGNDVKEGTLIYDGETQVITVCLGCKYNSEDPEAAFRMEEPAADDAVAKAGKKAKSDKKDNEKHWVFVGTKVIDTTTANY